jgi:hypothetical protein
VLFGVLGYISHEVTVSFTLLVPYDLRDNYFRTKEIVIALVLLSFSIFVNYWLDMTYKVLEYI